MLLAKKSKEETADLQISKKEVSELELFLHNYHKYGFVFLTENEHEISSCLKNHANPNKCYISDVFNKALLTFEFCRGKSHY